MKNILLTKNQIQTRLKEVAELINNSYDNITLLCALTGGIYTTCDLSKYITIPCKLEFVKISSYGCSKTSGIVELKWISALRGANLGNVIIVDDIYDTGRTIDYLVKYVQANYFYDDLKTFALLNKPKRRDKNIKRNLDYVGFEIDDLFVYGYGLDNSGYFRNDENIFCEDNC